MSTRPPDLDWHDLEDDQPPPDPWGEPQWADSSAASASTDGSSSEPTGIPTTSSTDAAEAAPEPVRTSAAASDPEPIYQPHPGNRPPLAIAWSDVNAAVTRQCQERRRRLLAHDDLARQLLYPPLRYSRPEVWNGYIPPETDCTGRRNDSTRRQQLIAILDALTKREQET